MSDYQKPISKQVRVIKAFLIFIISWASVLVFCGSVGWILLKVVKVAK